MGMVICITSGGPGSGRHPGFGKMKPAVNKFGKPIVTPRQQLALRNAKPAGKVEQDTADKGEQLVRGAIKNAIRSANNKPFDVLTRDGKHAIEVKTMVIAKNDRIIMKRDAIERKYKYANDNNMRVHTVVVDMRGGKLNGVYHKEGVGAFSLSTMNKLSNGFKGLDNAIRRRFV